VRTPELILAEGFNSVPSPLGEKGRMRGSWEGSTGFRMR
jgi:hypothetical protein